MCKTRVCARLKRVVHIIPGASYHTACTEPAAAQYAAIVPCERQSRQSSTAVCAGASAPTAIMYTAAVLQQEDEGHRRFYCCSANYSVFTPTDGYLICSPQRLEIAPEDPVRESRDMH